MQPLPDTPTQNKVLFLVLNTSTRIIKIIKALKYHNLTVETVFFKLQGKYLQLQDCCSEFQIPSVVLKDDRPLSIVYGGGFVIDEEYPDLVSWRALIKDCEENKCHLHIYPTANGFEEKKRTIYADYVQMSENSEYFHFHNPAPVDKLIETEAKYDYGICSYLRVAENAQSYGYYAREKYFYAPTNKLYDYIDAGIPIVANFPEKLVEYMAQFGIVVNYSCDEYDFEYLKAHRDELRAKVPAAKEKFLMKDHILKLLDLVMPKD